MPLRVVHEVRVGVERVEDVAEDEPVDDVQQDEGRGEEHPGHAVLQKYLMFNKKIFKHCQKFCLLLHLYQLGEMFLSYATDRHSLKMLT